MHTPTSTHAPDAEDTRSAAERLFAGPGAARALARSLDWASTQLGPVGAWPQSLRTAVDICLGSRFPTALLWGSDLTIIHNDANIPILGTRFPEAMGRPAAEALSDTWPSVGPIVAQVLAADVNAGMPELTDVAVTFDRGGPPRPGRFTVSFSAVHDESGRPAGVMCVAFETTSRALAEAALRESEGRQAFLLTLSDTLRAQVGVESVGHRAVQMIAEQLGADRVYLVTLNPDNDRVAVTHETRRADLPPLLGEYRSSTFPSAIREIFEHTIVYEDVRVDPRLTELDRVSFAGLNAVGFMAASIRRGTESMIWAAGAVSTRPRAWTSTEVGLFEDAVERTWAAVERARAEAALRETRDRLEQALVTTRMAYWNSDPTADTTFASASMEELFGLPPGERFGSSARGLALVHPDDREQYQALVQEASSRGEGWHAEFRIVGPHDAAVIWLEEQGTVTIDPVSGARHTNGLVWDISDRKRIEANAEIARVERDRVALHRQLAAVEEDERRRLARELHDEVGQHLTALGLGLRTLSDVVPANSEVDRRAAELSAVVSTMGQELHDVAVRLRPRALDDFGLEAAIEAYAEEWSHRSGIEIDVHTREGSQRLPDVVEGAVYRIVQEALTNVARHSEATRAGVVVERHDGHVVAIVEDNGHGVGTGTVQPKQLYSTSGGLGLVGIRERAALLGGSVEVESMPSGGTTLFVRIPIDPSSDALTSDDDSTDDDANV